MEQPLCACSHMAQQLHPQAELRCSWGRGVGVKPPLTPVTCIFPGLISLNSFPHAATEKTSKWQWGRIGSSLHGA